MLRSRNYLFSALAPTSSIILAPAPATAIYCHLNLFYNSSTVKDLKSTSHANICRGWWLIVDVVAHVDVVAPVDMVAHVDVVAQ